MWAIFKVFIEFVTILLLFYLLVFLALRHVGSSLSEPGSKPLSSALEGEVLTTGPPGKSQALFQERKKKLEGNSAICDDTVET